MWFWGCWVGGAKGYVPFRQHSLCQTGSGSSRLRLYSTARCATVELWLLTGSRCAGPEPTQQATATDTWAQALAHCSSGPPLFQEKGDTRAGGGRREGPQFCRVRGQTTTMVPMEGVTSGGSVGAVACSPQVTIRYSGEMRTHLSEQAVFFFYLVRPSACASARCLVVPRPSPRWFWRDSPYFQRRPLSLGINGLGSDQPARWERDGDGPSMLECALKRTES